MLTALFMFALVTSPLSHAGPPHADAIRCGDKPIVPDDLIEGTEIRQGKLRTKPGYRFVLRNKQVQVQHGGQFTTKFYMCRCSSANGDCGIALTEDDSADCISDGCSQCKMSKGTIKGTPGPAPDPKPVEPPKK